MASSSSISEEGTPGAVPSVVASECTNCGRVMFPRHSRCTQCGKTSFTDRPLSEGGSIVTWTRLTATRPGFAREIYLVIVEFAGEGVRVLGQFDPSGGAPREGSPVHVIAGTLSAPEGRPPVLGFKFVAEPSDQAV